MKKYIFLVTVVIIGSVTGLVPTARAADCTIGQYCTTATNTNGMCIRDFDGLAYCSPITTNSGTSGGININYIKPYSDSIIGIINTIFVPVLIAIAFIVFLWGVYKYFIYHGEEESAKMEGRKYAMWGIIGLAVIFSVWALVNILMGALNLGGGKPPPIPKL